MQRSSEPSDVLVAMCREHIASKRVIDYGFHAMVVDDVGLETAAIWLAREFEAVADLQLGG